MSHSKDVLYVGVDLIFHFNVLQLFSPREGGKFDSFILFLTRTRKVLSGHSEEINIPVGKVSVLSHLRDWTTDQRFRLS